MISFESLIEEVKQQLVDDAPTTEIVEKLDALNAHLPKFDAAILFVVDNEMNLQVNVIGDEREMVFALAVQCLDAVAAHIETINNRVEEAARLEAESASEVSE